MPKPEKNSGFICLHRSIREHWIYEDATKLKWWLDILMECNHSDRKVSIGFELIDCKRGQSINSLKTWSEMWRVDKSTARRFFKLLQRDGMVKSENVKKTTRLTVCNYDDYNSKRHSTQLADNSDATQTQLRRNPNNNANNDNNVNNDKKGIDGAYGSSEREEFIKFEKWLTEKAERVTQMKNPFTIQQYFELKQKNYPKELIRDLLQAMHNRKDLISKNLSAYLTLLNWLKRELNGTHKSTSTGAIVKPLGTSKARLEAARNF